MTVSDDWHDTDCHLSDRETMTVYDD